MEMKNFIREAKKHHFWKSSNPTFRNFLKTQNQSGSAFTKINNNNSINDQLLKQQQHEQKKLNLTQQEIKTVLQEYTFLLKSIRDQTETFIKYNIGTYVEDRERLEKASRRVGLRLPEFADEKELKQQQTTEQSKKENK